MDNNYELILKEDKKKVIKRGEGKVAKRFPFT